MARRRVPAARRHRRFSFGREPRCGMRKHCNDGAPVALAISLAPFAALLQSIVRSHDI